jgi:alkylated DNA repair dioxygenase AlkB
MASEKTNSHIENPKMDLLVDWKNGLFVCLDKNFYNKQIADEIYVRLKKEIIYDKNSVIRIFGKNIPIPRKQTAFGDPGTTYTFSGMTVKAKPWTSILNKIKSQVEIATGKKYNFCLVNYYENGNNYIGYHKDDEKDLGKNPSIASLSFGQERKFYFKSDNKSLPVVKTKLSHGSLCYMMHPTNIYWKHSVPKESVKICSKPRINLTFRWIEITDKNKKDIIDV